MGNKYHLNFSINVSFPNFNNQKSGIARIGPFEQYILLERLSIEETNGGSDYR